MKKLFSFALCLMIVILSAITCSAKSVDVSLKAEKSGSKTSDVSVFVQSDALIGGGNFAISFDENAVGFKDVSSDVFEVDSYVENSKLEIIVASKTGVDVSENTGIFTVKFSRLSDSDFDITLETKSLVDKNLRDFSADISKVNCTVDVDSNVVMKNSTASKKETAKKEKSTENSKKTKAEKTAVKSTENEKETSATEGTQLDEEISVLKVNSPKRNTFLLIAMVVALVASVFVFGFVFRKYFVEKKDKK